MKEKKHPNFQDLYSFEDYKAAYEARATFNCGLSPICLSAPDQHYSIHTKAISDDKASSACMNFRTLKLEYAIQVWLKAALISSYNPGPLLFYWWLHYEDNDTAFREVKYCKNWWGATPEAMNEGFWNLLKEIANSGNIKVSEGYKCRNNTVKYVRNPSIEYDIILDREEVRNAYEDFDVYNHDYKSDKVSYSWEEIKPFFTQLTLKQLSLIDEKLVHKHGSADDILFKACDALDIDAVKTAIRMGADVNSLDESGKSALQHAVEYFTEHGILMDKEYSDEEREQIEKENYNKCVEIVDYLLKLGADIDLFGTDGMQPISCAYYAHSIDMIKHLLEKGSNPNYNSYRSDDVHWHSDDSAKCTILDVIGGLLSEDYDDYAKEVESIVRNYGGRRYDWDYDTYRYEHLGKYYLSMSPDNKDRLFFANDGWGIGTESDVTIEDSDGNQTKLNLPHIDGLKEWHQDYHNHISDDNYDWDEWNQRGRTLAKIVAGILPESVALYYPYGTEISRKWNEWSKKYHLVKIRGYVLVNPDKN